VFRLLGPIEVRADGTALDVGPPRQRAVLAALLVDAGRPVPMSTLIGRVWDDAPPPEARNVVYGHLSRIRRLLAEAAESDTEGMGGLDLRRERSGYVLDVEPDLVDVHRFRRLADDARGQADDAQRATLLAQALEQWTDAPMTDLSSAWADRVRERLRRERLDVFLDWGRAMLHRHEPDPVLAGAFDLHAEHPHSEPVAEVLIRALYDSGRAAEALDCYEAVRQRLAEDLGTVPGTELQGLHQAMLRGEVESHGRLGERVVPFQLPGDVVRFTGRDQELAWLDKLLEVDGPVVAAVVGGGGVGKTALAVHWAYRVQHHFPDGQLYVDLRDYDPEMPVSPEVALTGFLRALGVDDTEIPLNPADRAALFRTLVSDRRMLVVVDNAASAEHVRPLLPGGSTCVLLVTSRDSMAGLVARHGAERLQLERLPLADAVRLFRRLLGSRVDREPVAAAELAEACVRLPLALRIAAEFAATRPRVGIADLVHELADRSDRLELLDAGDPHTRIRSVLSWSYEGLPESTARIFRLVGLLPGPDFDPHTTAALADVPVAQAQRELDTLGRAHLVERDGGRRFTMHDLLRAYSMELAEAEDGAEECGSARQRLYDYFLSGMRRSRDLIYPGEFRTESYDPTSRAYPPITDADAALSWLDKEHANLIAAVMTADQVPSFALRLTSTASRLMDSRCNSVNALMLHTRALDLARKVGDVVQEAHATAGIALAYRRRGDYAAAATEYESALGLYRVAGRTFDEMTTRSNIGLIMTRLGDHANGTTHLEAALQWVREAGEKRMEGHVLNVLGDSYETQGRYRTALAQLRLALECFGTVGDDYGTARTLMNMGRIGSRFGLPDTETHLHRALDLGRAVGYLPIVGHVKTTLGIVYESAGDLAAAVSAHEEALAVFRDQQDRFGEAQSLTNLASVLVRRGELSEAESTYRESADLLRRIGMKSNHAAALNGLAETRRNLGDTGEATDRFEEALSLARAAGDPYQQARAHDGLADILSGESVGRPEETDLASAHRHRMDDLLGTLEIPAQSSHLGIPRLAPTG
jgi:DNA-binding SARP family transcriptional activator/tetratricopeptide (TPR) repeat protein